MPEESKDRVRPDDAAVSEKKKKKEKECGRKAFCYSNRVNGSAFKWKGKLTDAV